MKNRIQSIEDSIYEGKLSLVSNSALAFAFLLTTLEVQRYFVVGSLHPLGFPFNSSMILALFACWVYTQHTGNLKVAARLIITIFCSLFFGLTFLAGGLSAPFVIVGTVIPLLAFVAAGTRTCLITAFIIIAYYLLMAIMTKINGSFGLEPLNNETRYSLYAAYSIALIALTTWIGWFFRKTNRELLNYLRQDANTDFLTQIPNRRSIENQLEIEFKRSQRQSTWLSILMIDIDHFKKINDTYGHQAGDFCLAYIAEILRFNIQRSGDSIGRYGGEEFICILPETNTRGAFRVAEKLRKSVENAHCILEDGTKISLTVTIGVQSDICGKDTRLEKMISKADELLYKGKQSGRNRVESLLPDLNQIIPAAKTA